MHTFKLRESLFCFSVPAFHFLQVFQEFVFPRPALLEERLQLSETHRQLDDVARSLDHIFVLMGETALHSGTNKSLYVITKITRLKPMVHLKLEHGTQLLLPDLQGANFVGKSHDRGVETLVLLLRDTTVTS